MEKVFVSVADACAALGISRSQFYREAAAARLNTVKLGTRTLVRVAELHRFAETL